MPPSTDEIPSHFVNVNKETSGIYELKKMQTTSIIINNQNYTIKACTQEQIDQEMQYYRLLSVNLPIVKHQVIDAPFNKILLRGPMTPRSIGDYVYSYYMCKEPIAIDKSHPETLYQEQQKIQSIFTSKTFENLNILYHHRDKLSGIITLDNIDTDGQLYDFGDFGLVKDSNIEIAYADFVNYYSQYMLPPQDCFKIWFPIDYNAITEGNWLDKVLALNNNILNAECKTTELFIDTETSTTHSYYNPIFGYKQVNTDLLDKQVDLLQQLYYIQDPAMRGIAPIEALSNTITCHKYGEDTDGDAKPVYYNIESYEDLKKRGVDCDSCLNYGYFQGSSANVKADFNFYTYQSNLFLQPHILKFLYERTLKDFSVNATDKRFGYEDCKPNKSSLGPSHPILRGIKQDFVYEALPLDVIDNLVELAIQTPLIFTTKVTDKFALTAKPRARTIAACSMFASTLFRACHKPVTANFVSKAQTFDSHCLIGVSKFYQQFDKFIKTRYGNLNQYNVFGSDYTKCDRSFPLIFRAMAAALLFELGDWDPKGNLFVNEIQAFMLDFVIVGESIFQKPGGTSSGDATTAFANTLYNHMVHLYVQLQHLVTTDVHDNHVPFKNAAVQLWQTGNSDLYSMFLDQYNNNDYRFNFLSDDSFILTRKDPTLPDIFNTYNFSRRLETLIHTVVDDSKAWQGDDIHEFCSSHIVEVDNVYQFVPDKNRLIAALLITGKAPNEELDVIRTAAILAESAIYSSVDPPFWKALYGHFLSKYDSYTLKYDCTPLPTFMRDEKFFLYMISDKGEVYYDMFESAMAGFELQAKEAVTTCYCCPNITVSRCLSCPVSYPLCASCAYTHYCDTKHLVTHLPKCQEYGCGENDPSQLYYCSDNHKVDVYCKDHQRGFSLPTIDHMRSLLRIPHSNSCVKQSDDVVALSDTLQNAEAIDYFKYDPLKSQTFNHLRLVHHSYIAAAYSEAHEPTCSYEVVDYDGRVIRILDKNGNDPCYGFTTYCNIYDSKDHVVVKCTADPLGNSLYHLTFVDFTTKFIRCNKIQRTPHQTKLLPLSAFKALNNAQFILGPPGTGKTTFFIENYFANVSNFNRVIYCAPTHKLIQDMDKSIGVRNDVSIIVSKHNNRTYLNSLNNIEANILLGTINVLRPVKGCTLLIDECSLLTPVQLLEAINQVCPSRIVIVGDPFQLAPVLPNREFNWSYTDFYLTHLIHKSNITNLSCCYRCPSEIFNSFAKPYRDAGITFYPHKDGGNFKLNITKFHYNQNLIDEKLIDGLVDKFDIVLSNYKAATVYAATKGYSNVITIDSAQGLTAGRVAVIVFGHSNFSKVINRLIVAFSRATTQLDLYVDSILGDYINSNLALTTPLLQSKPNYNCDILEVSQNIAATGVCDIEFYHCKQPGHANHLGLGEITVYTTKVHSCFIRPRYIKDGINKELTNKEIFTQGPWKYMMHKLPTAAQSIVYTNNLIEHILTTTDLKDSPFIFLLYNGKHDITALQQICTYGDYKCADCNDPARAMTEHSTYCQFHALHQSYPLTHLINPKFYDYTVNAKLVTEHAKVCNFNHGLAHSSSVDVNMTACVIGNKLSEITPFYTNDHGWVKVSFSTLDAQNRLYGKFLFHENQRIKYPHTPNNTLPPAPSEHDSIYCIKPPTIPYGCHPTSQIHICSKCLWYYKQFFSAQYHYADYGYEYQTSVSLQSLNKQQKQLKLKAELIPMANGELMVYCDNVAIPFFQNLDQTIKKLSYYGNYPIPKQSVLAGLCVTCSYKLTVPSLPVKELDEIKPWDIVISYEELKIPNKQVILSLHPVNKKYKWHGSATAAICLPTSNHPFVNKSGTPSFYLRTVNFEVPDTLWSTGRIENKDYFKFPHESIFNVHIDIGEASNDSYTIGGNHMFPSAFENTNFTETYSDVNKPTHNLSVVKYKGVKTCCSVIDVFTNDFYELVHTMINEGTVSLKTTINIDFQAIPIMIWASHGMLTTAYTQAGGRDDEKTKDRLFLSSDHYVEWKPIPCVIPNEIDRPQAYHIAKNKLAQANNVTKYLQICHFINDQVKLCPKPRVLDFGASSGVSHDFLPVGGIILEHFFGDTCDHFDIKQVHSRPNNKSGKYDLIVSDVFVEGDDEHDNTQLLKNTINEHLALGGTILWKTTRRNKVNNIPSIALQFGKVSYFTPRCNLDSTEVYICFSYYAGFAPKDKVVFDYDVLQAIAIMRANYSLMVRDTDFDLKFKHKFHPVTSVPQYMLSRITQQMWKTGRFRCITG